MSSDFERRGCLAGIDFRQGEERAGSENVRSGSVFPPVRDELKILITKGANALLVAKVDAHQLVLQAVVAELSDNRSEFGITDGSTAMKFLCGRRIQTGSKKLG
jgi:hypothetical protein